MKIKENSFSTLVFANLNSVGRHWKYKKKSKNRLPPYCLTLFVLGPVLTSGLPGLFGVNPWTYEVVHSNLVYWHIFEIEPLNYKSDSNLNQDTNWTYLIDFYLSFDLAGITKTLFVPFLNKSFGLVFIYYFFLNIFGRTIQSKHKFRIQVYSVGGGLTFQVFCLMCRTLRDITKHLSAQGFPRNCHPSIQFNLNLSNMRRKMRTNI
jgi:hypothetical protein